MISIKSQGRRIYSAIIIEFTKKVPEFTLIILPKSHPSHKTSVAGPDIGKVPR